MLKTEKHRFKILDLIKPKIFFLKAFNSRKRRINSRIKSKAVILIEL